MPEFHAPSHRATASDLTIQISPLGLVELSDEEFEVHGPRLNRYSQNWAMYLGHHWAYRREAGEPQTTFNYVRALSDFITNFTFGRGVKFKTPKTTEAIVPNLLQRVWEVDNHKAKTLWSMGQLGSVTGDCPVKVAYEEPWVDPAGRTHRGRVRIIPLNPAFSFPEFHPHDRSRLIRFKLKYRFWNTSDDGTRQVSTYSEILTDEWIEEYIDDNLIDSRPNTLGQIPIVFIPNIPIEGSPWGLSDINDVVPLNREYNEKSMDLSDIINYHCVDAETEILTASGWKRHDALTIGEQVLGLDPESDEIVWQSVEAVNTFKHTDSLVQWDNRIDAVTTPNHRWLAERKVGRPENVRYERQFVRTSQAEDGDPAAGDLREGSRLILGGGVPAHFPTEPKYDDELVETVGWFVTEGWYGLQGTAANPITTLSQSETKNPTHTASIRRLAAYWRKQGGSFTEQRKRENGVVCWYLGTTITETLLGVAPNKGLTPEFLTSLTYQQAERLYRILVDADGARTPEGREVWYQDDRSRRDGFQMLAAMLNGARTRSYENSEGSGVVDSYQTRTTEILSTVNRATEVSNPSGIVWCPTVPTGVWFARRNGNTYWTGNSAPVTVITGAKANQLEKGPKKVWGNLPKDANVFNLDMTTNLSGPIAYLEMLKQAMHEMTGVPQGALGEKQQISNTSGVALAIQYQPMMNRFSLKTNQYGFGIERINELILLTLAVKEPWSLQFNPYEESHLKPGQLAQLDPHDPITFQTTTDFPPPLPTDVLIKLNEIQAKMELGLESKRGALRELGEEFPDERTAEIYEELREDIMSQGALDLLRTSIQYSIGAALGIVPEDEEGTGGGSDVASAGGAGVTHATGASTGGMDLPEGVLPGAGSAMPQVAIPSDPAELMNQLVTRAYGTKLAQRRKSQDRETS